MCVAIPCRIESIAAGEGMSLPARVSHPDGTISVVDLVMVPEAAVGDYVISHSGFAISTVTRAEAATTLALLSGEPTPPTEDART